MTNLQTVNLEMFPTLERERVTSGHLIVEAESIDQEATFLLDTAEDALKAGEITQANMAMSRADTLLSRSQLLHRYLNLLTTTNDQQGQRTRWAKTVVNAGEHTSARMVQMLDQHWIAIQQQAHKEVAYGARHWIYAAIAIQARLATTETLQDNIQRHSHDHALQNIAVQALEFALDDARHHAHQLYTTDPNTVGLIPTDTMRNLESQAHEAISTMQRIVQTELREFNQRLPTRFSSLADRLPENERQQLNSLNLSPSRMTYLTLDPQQFPTEVLESRSLFVAYYHDDARQIKAATEPFPKDYSTDQANRQVASVIANMATNEDPSADHALAEALLAMQMIELEIHNTTPEDIAEILAPLFQRASTHQHAGTIVRAICQTPEITDVFQRTGVITDWRVTSQQANTIIDAALKAGLQPTQLRELALHLGHESKETRDQPKTMPLDTQDEIISRADQLGFSRKTLSRLSAAFF